LSLIPEITLLACNLPFTFCISLFDEIRDEVITDQEKQLQDVIFGKDIVTEVKKQLRKTDSTSLHSVRFLVAI
jgi:hypothetical protein